MIMAATRFMNLAETDNGYFLDHANGLHAIQFYPTFLKHTSGPLAGTPFRLMPHQQFGIYQLFGMKKFNEMGEPVRLIRNVYEKVARKNGKSATLAGIGLYCQSFDGEFGPEIYVGATKKEQAKIIWEQAEHFIRTSTKLRKIGFTTTQTEIRFPRTLGKFKAVSKEAKNLDGLKPSVALIDEYHAHATDDVREVLESGMGSRKQPILYMITTAGFNLSGVCRNFEEVCVDILKEIKRDDATLVLIHDLDDDDDWEDPGNWAKANPNLGKSVYMDFLMGEYTKAKNQPSKAPNFKTKHLNMWVDGYSTRIPDGEWMQNTDKPKLENFIKYGCCGGMDLSSKKDLSSYVLVSNPDPDGIIDVLPFNFCPLDTLRERSKEDRVPYQYWSTLPLLDYVDFGKQLEEKYSYLKEYKVLNGTPGNEIDYDYIFGTIMETFWTHAVKWIEYDKYKSTELVQRLVKHDVEMHIFYQSVGEYSNPTSLFETKSRAGKIRHGGNPLLRWCISNIMPYINNNEDVRYIKKHEKKRVDPIQSIIMAIGGNITEDNKDESVYNDPDREIIM